MIFAWLTSAAFGLPRWLWAALALVLLVTAVVLLGSCDDEREIGRVEERSKTQQEVLKRTEKANEVRQEVDRDARARYDVCLQTARTPANCERLLH